MSEVPAQESYMPHVETPPDELLGDAVEEFLERTERTGRSPEIESFLTEFPHCGEELRSALEGLAVVHGMLGSGGSSRSEVVLKNLTAPATLLKPGNSLAGYRIVRELGRGGMGVVYEAVHVDLDRPVALKVLRDWSGGSARRRFLNEAKTAASLHHTNIVPVFDVGQTENTTYYAMQKIDGEGLDRLIRRRRGVVEESVSQECHDSSEPTFVHSSNATEVIRIAQPDDSDSSGSSEDGKPPQTEAPKPHPAQLRRPPDTSEFSLSGRDAVGFSRWVARVGYQAAMALDYAHKRQVVHRDIKPSNLILDLTGTIWVTDFGLALRLDDPGLSRGDGVLGTPRYTSPEQAARKVVDYRTDIYSLGATLYELLTGTPAFDGESSDDVIRKILTGAPVPLRDIDPNVSRDLETIILKAMANRPEDRYATASELADDLERFLRHEPVRARRIGPIGRFSRLVQRHPAVSTVIVAAASVIMGIATVAYRQVATERDDALAARAETLVALKGEKTALEKAKSAMRRQLWREASLVRLSAVPNRRRTILELVAEAASYEPEPELRSKLRNEVVEALSLSDVRAEPALTENPLAGFEIMTDQQRAVTLSEDNRTMTVWDIASRMKRAEVQLDTLFGEVGQDRSKLLPEPRDEREAAESKTGGRGGPPGQFAPMSRRFARLIVSIGSTVGVVRPDYRGILWVDAGTAEPRGDWPCPESGFVLAVQPVGLEPRLLTIEYHAAAANAVGRIRGPFSGFLHPDDEFRVCIHDLKDAKAEPLVLERLKVTADRGRFFTPVLSLSTDGEWVAVGRLFEEEIRILDTRTGRQLGQFSAQVPVTSIAAGPHRMLAAAGGGSIRLWRHEVRPGDEGATWSATALPSLGTNLGAIRQIRFAPDSKLIAASGRTSGIELWDIDSGQAVATLATTGQVDHIAFASSGGRLLASVDEPVNGGLKLWTIEKPVAKRFVASSPDPVMAMTLLKKDERSTLFTQGISGTVRYLSDSDDALKKLDLPTDKSVVSALRGDDKGRFWLFMDRAVQRFDAWSSETPALTRPSERVPIADNDETGWSMRGFGLTRMPSGLVFAADSDRVFTSRGPLLMMLDPAVENAFVPIQMSSSSIGPPPSDNGRGGPRDRRDGSSGRPPETKSNLGGGRDRPLSSRPSEPLAGFPAVFRGPTPFSRRLSVSPKGDQFAILRGASWEFWYIENMTVLGDAKSWKAQRMPAPAGAPTSDVSALAMSPDGRLLALGTRDGRVTLIDVPVWRVIQEIRPESPQDDGPTAVYELKFLPDDPSFLAVVGQRSVSFWCCRSEPTHFLDLPADLNSSTPIVWESNGKGIYLVEEDRNVYYWDLERILTTIFEMKLR